MTDELIYSDCQIVSDPLGDALYELACAGYAVEVAAYMTERATLGLETCAADLRQLLRLLDGRQTGAPSK